MTKRNVRQDLLARKAAEAQKIAHANAIRLAKAEENKRIAQEKAAEAKRLRDEAAAKAKAAAIARAEKAKEAQILKSKALAQARLLYKARVSMLREARFKIDLEKVKEKIEDEKASTAELKKLIDQKTRVEKELTRLGTLIDGYADEGHNLFDIELRPKIEAEMKEEAEPARPRKRF